MTFFRVDACESKIEIVTPYWASNSAGKIRAIVNTQHFEQAIHQEVCTLVQINKFLREQLDEFENLMLFLGILAGKRKRPDVAATVAANRNTNGTGCWLMIQITIARVSSWTGFCFRRAVFAGVIRKMEFWCIPERGY